MKNTEIIKYIKKRLKITKEINIKEIKGDASKRKYYRVVSNRKSYIVMDSGLEKRNFNNFLKYTKIFKENDVNTPALFDINIKKKIILIEDLGNNLIFNKVNNKNLNNIYENVILNILKIQKIRNKNINYYSYKKYLKESLLFNNWVLREFLNFNISKKDEKKIYTSLTNLINSINTKFNKLVHRDYHSKNIFFKNKKTIIIDYQDALYGSPIYDLVSILNDCYKDIDIKTKKNLLNLFNNGFNDDNKIKLSSDELLYNFDMLSIQRHMKASGIFCRLSKKYNRHNYLQYLYRTFNYIEESSSKYGNLKIINFFAKEALNTLNESNNFSCRQR